VDFTCQFKATDWCPLSQICVTLNHHSSSICYDLEMAPQVQAVTVSLQDLKDGKSSNAGELHSMHVYVGT